MRTVPFRKCMLIALIVGVMTCVMISLASHLWEASRGAVPTASGAMLGLVLLTPLLNRLAHRIGGYAAVIVTCRSVAAIAVLVALVVSDSFARAFFAYEPFRFGDLGFAHVSVLTFLLFAALGACAGWVEVSVRSHRWNHVTYDPTNTSREVKRRSRISVIFGWIVIAMAAVILICVYQKHFRSPTPERYLGSLAHLGDVPPVTTELPPVRWEPSAKTSLPNVVPTDPIGGYHLARYCNEMFCELWIAHEPLPATDEDPHEFPAPATHITIAAHRAVAFDYDAVHELLILTDREEKIWLPAKTLTRDYPLLSFGPEDLAVPTRVCAGGALGIFIGILLMLRKPRDAEKKSDNFEPARILRDGRIVFDDDRPTAYVPGAHQGVDGDVLVTFKERAPSFRDAGAPKIERVIFGTIAELRAEELQALHARAALAIAIAFVMMAPVAAGALLGMI